MWLLLEDDRPGGRPTVAVRLPEGAFVIGRDAGCDLVVRGDTISRRHVALERHGAAVTFRDLGSALGTRFNGKKTATGTLEPGDHLSLDRLILRLVEELPALERSQPVSAMASDEAPSLAVDWQPFRSFLEELRRSSNPKQLLERLLLGLVDIFGAERGFVLLRSVADAKLVPVASCSIADTDSFVAVSSTVYEEALRSKAVVVIEDTLKDALCVGAPSLAEKDMPRSIVCGPLRAGAETLGVIYIDMPRLSLAPASDRLHLFEVVTGLASEFLTAAHTRDTLLATKGQLETLNRLVWENEELVLGDGAAGKEIRELLDAAAPEDVSVLLTGETGTGKEMVARALHRLSRRRNGPFVPVNCAALPRELIEAELFGAEKGAFTGATEARVGRFELASSGTLFLDEVGDLPLDFQVKLLRVLQERSISRLGSTTSIPLHFRLICATNADLEEVVRAGLFRQDFYFRINVFKIDLSPLRERREDIMPLAQHFLQTFATRFGRKLEGFAPEAEKLLHSYNWPGNVRELKNAVERAVVIEKDKRVRAESLPIGGKKASGQGLTSSLVDQVPDDYREARTIFERAFFENALERTHGNVAATARLTGLTRYAVYRRLEKLGLVAKK